MRNLKYVALIAIIVVLAGIIIGTTLIGNNSNNTTNNTNNTLNESQNTTNNTNTTNTTNTSTKQNTKKKSGSNIAKQTVKENYQAGDGSHYKEVEYKDGNFRQYDSNGKLIGSSYKSDQAKLKKEAGDSWPGD